jgi:hypothetical protein
VDQQTPMKNGPLLVHTGRCGDARALPFPPVGG